MGFFFCKETCLDTVGFLFCKETCVDTVGILFYKETYVDTVGLLKTLSIIASFSLSIETISL